MKTIKLIALVMGAAFAVLASAATAQIPGTFQNLNFEQANPVPIVGSPYYPYMVTAASALPGWTAYLGNEPTPQVLYNNLSTGAVSVDLAGPGFFIPSFIINGDYSVVLQYGGGASPGESASIAQTGTIPLNAESLVFSAWDTSYFAVSFAGENLPPIIVSTSLSSSGQTYNIYGVNIAPYAGETGQLEFSVNQGNLVLDDISFSPTPEPSIVALSALGGLLFGARNWLAWRG